MITFFVFIKTKIKKIYDPFICNLINIEQSPIAIIAYKNEDYISLTDMARSQMQEAVIIKWLSLKSTIEQLVVLSNMESINAVLIHQGLQQPQRLQELNSIAISQMKSLMANSQIKKLK